MAKRESQGMQIALILLVMLSVLFAITTIVFWNIGKNAKASLAQKTSAADQATSDMREAVNENLEFKRMLGQPADVSLESVQTLYETDMQKFGASFPAEERNYHKLPEHMGNAIDDLHNQLRSANERVKELEASNETLKKETDAMIAQVRKEKEDATREYLAERGNFDQELATLKTQQGSVQGKWQSTKSDLESQNRALTTKVESLEGDVTKMRSLNDKLSLQLAQLRNESFETPDGEITWVDNRGLTVYVNLGSDDALRAQTTFSVYDIDENNLARSDKKASIEVTRVLGPHVAEAKVIEDDVTNPIVSGDIIYSPIWQVGNPVRFALTGFMDIDNDGRSDRALIQRLIRMNGGVIDAEVSDRGKRSGELSIQTRYLVSGDIPNEKTSTSVARADSTMRSEAKSLGLTEISVDRLLSDLGYQKISKAVALGEDASEVDYRDGEYDPR